MDMPETLDLPCVQNGGKCSIRLPSSKSVLLRQLFISGLANQPTDLVGCDQSSDSDAMIRALQSLGVLLAKKAEHSLSDASRIWTIDPTLVRREGNHVLNLHASGMSLRSLLALPAIFHGSLSYDGLPSLRARPNSGLLNALSELGCAVQSEGGRLPIRITGPATRSIVTLDATLSSQYLSALLLVAPCMPKGIEIHLNNSVASKPYVELTIHEMSRRGIHVVKDWDAGMLKVEPQTYRTDAAVAIEGDASAASYFAAMATLHGKRVNFPNLSPSTLQGDFQFLQVCKQIGASVEFTSKGATVQGTDVRRPVDEINMQDMPDAALTLMAMAPFLLGTTRITGLHTLRYKECDRISCPVIELRKAGVKIIEGEDFVEISGGGPYRSAVFDSYDDHRMAMSLAVFGSMTQGCRIRDPHCVNKTYPSFWNDFARFRSSDDMAGEMGSPHDNRET